MTEAEAINLFRETQAFLSGHFRLSSGLHSAEYLQPAPLLQYPQKSVAVCRGLAEVIQKEGWPKPDVVIGPALGAVIIAYELARQLDTKAYFAERADGAFALRRGFSLTPDDKVLVAENMVTTGGSAQEVVELVKQMGADPIGVATLVDRSKGKSVLSVPLCSLVRLDTREFSAEDCPLCKEGMPLVKPGSRPT
jgi:orotate phosphoribosyltransferase